MNSILIHFYSGGRTFGAGTTIHQEALDFSEGDGELGAFAIFAIRFSGDDREVVAGAGDDSIYVFDIETKRVSFSARAHTNDVNAVAFCDEKNSNLVFSGSDDAMIHIWDRRVFRSSARSSTSSTSNEPARPDGSFIGHTEGITYMSGKGDGVYLLSNAKDQTLKLWDIRKLSEYSPDFKPKYRQRGWDYRMSFFPMLHPGSRRQAEDTSLLTCVGHQTLQTLIRCGFSPAQSTGQRYLYCGSYDGCVYIYNLNGEVVKKLKAGESLVRDASWHPYDQVLMATAWDGTIQLFTHDPEKEENANDAMEVDGVEDDGDEPDSMRDDVQARQ